MTDINEWDEITIRTPGWKATPDQIADFLRAVFPEDAILNYQRRIVEGGMREQVAETREALDKKYVEIAKQHGRVPKDMLQLTEGLLELMDPDSPEWGGFFPSRLLCPHHETGTDVPRSMAPAMTPCPGYPSCQAGLQIRQASR